jgi:hypothetical protein
MRRFLFVFFLLPTLLSPLLFAQSKAGPFTMTSTSSPCATITVSAQSTVGIQVTGTFSLTLTPEVSIQGQAPQDAQVTPSTSSTAQSTITTAGAYRASGAGYDTFLLCPTAYTSGTATVWLNASPATGAGLVGGGGGTVTAVTGVSPITSTGGTTPAIGCATCATGSGVSEQIAYWLGTSSLTGATGLTIAFLTSPLTAASTFVTIGDGNEVAGGGGGSLTLKATTNVSGQLNIANSSGFTAALNDVGSGANATFKLNASSPGTYILATTNQVVTATNCAAVGTAASPSVASCTGAPAGAFSCDPAASGATCTVNTTIVTANSEILVTLVASESTRLGVTCNNSPSLVPAVLLATKTAGTGFTVNAPTFTTNPVCFDFLVIN